MMWNERKRVRSAWDLFAFEGSEFVRALQTAAVLDAAIRSERVAANDDWIVLLREQLQTLSVVLNGLGVRAAHAQCENVIAILDRNGADKVSVLRQALPQIVERLRDEMMGVHLYHLDSGESRWLSISTEGSWAHILAAFPDIREDVERAGECMAFSQHTAAIFHLMRAMELVVRKCGQKIGATVVQSDGAPLFWGKIMANIKVKIEGMSKPSPEWDRWSDLHLKLQAVGEAWRNDTMHPKTTYDRSEAEAIFAACGFFMMRASTVV